MIKIYPYEELGHANYGWLDARYHFSFANYHNPNRMGFGKLRVINDDLIKAGAGFDTHPHKDMEIITYVRSGAITHRDSEGNEGRIEAGDLQIINAGTGIFHLEYNLESKDASIYQIWIEPNKKAVKPEWNSCKFPEGATEYELKLLVSGDKKAPLFINQDAEIYAGKLRKDVVINHIIQRQAYFLVSKGEVRLNEKNLKKGDGAEITDISLVSLRAIVDSEVLLLDVPN